MVTVTKSVDIDSIIKALRDWGQGAVDAVIDRASVPALAGDAVARLRPWLQAPAPEDRNGSEGSLRQLTDLFRHRGVPAELSPLQMTVLQAALTDGKSEREGAALVFQEPMADRVLAAIAAAAWTDPGLRLHIAERGRAFLRTRVLFAAARPPVVALSPTVFWCLLASHAMPPLRESKDRRRLRTVAVRMALETGWLGYWDQWWLALWLDRHQHGRSAMSANLAQGLASLPIMREPEAETLAGWLRTRADQARAAEPAASGGATLAVSGDEPQSWSTRGLLRGTLARPETRRRSRRKRS